MKKILCSIMAVLMTAVMVSCDKKDNNSSTSGNQLVSNANNGVNVKEEDMPYGSTVYELSESNDNHVKYITCFDKRYFGGDDENNPDYSEVYAVHDYICALNANDHDTIRSLYYAGYLETACKENGYSDVNNYIDTLYNTTTTYLGDDFEINYIDISDCLSAENAGAAAYIETVDSYLEEIGALDKVTSKKVVEIGGYTCYSSGGNTYQLTNHMETIILGIYVIDGKAYIT